VAREIDAGMVPVVELGRAEDPAERAERQADVGVDEDGPHPPQGEQGRDVVEREAHHEGGEVHGELRAEAVQGVLAVRGEEVEVLGAVVDGVDAPERRERVAGAVKPVDQDVAQGDGGEGLRPEGRRPDPGAQARERREREPVPDAEEDREGDSAPEEVLAREEAQVDADAGAEHRLPGARGERALQRSKRQREQREAAERGEQQLEDHGTAGAEEGASDSTARRTA
jgi:hypothetical protein